MEDFLSAGRKRVELDPLEMQLAADISGRTVAANPWCGARQIPFALLLLLLGCTGLKPNDQRRAGAAGTGAKDGSGGAGGMASQLAAIAVVNTSCAREDDRACTGHFSVDKLICTARTWISAGSCDGDQRCDTTRGATEGTCQEIASLCIDKPAGAEVCDGTARKRCDADGLRYEADDCSRNMHCDSSAAVTCVCDAGYAHDDADGCSDLDECLQNSDECDDEPEACVNDLGTFHCACPTGYSGSGVGADGCTDIDECARNSAGCDDDPNACVNDLGSFHCRCPDGYTGSGGGRNGCTDVDECRDNTDGCDDDPDACINDEGSFHCGCPDGYTGKGVGSRGCSDRDECALDIDGCDDLPDACINERGAFRCECAAAYSGTAIGPAGCRPRVVDLASGSTQGSRHTCAVLASGAVRCWGSNFDGLLGDGTTEPRLGAVQVLGISNARQVSPGSNNTCAVLGDHTVRCWGSGDLAPVQVSGITDAVSVAGSCAVLIEGGVRCWPAGDPADQAAQGIYGVSAISRGASQFCSLRVSDEVQCFANGNWDTSLPTPAPVVGIASGEHHSCALLSDHSAACWGRNAEGQLGDNSGISWTTPTLVPGLTNVVQIAASTFQSCARLGDGTVRCWGSIYYADNWTVRTTPTAVDGLHDVLQVAPGSDHTCARLGDERVVCWGSNRDGRLGDGTMNDSQVPVEVVGLSD